MENDADIEIIFGSLDEGRIHALNMDGSKVLGFPLHVDYALQGSQCVANVDNNGKSELIAGSGNEIYMWETNGNSQLIERGSERHDHHNTGEYYEICPPAIITSDTTWSTNKNLFGDISMHETRNLHTMKRTILLTILICFSYLLYGQSPITEFEEIISSGRCDYVRAWFHYISSSTADCDSVCWDFGDGKTHCNSHTSATSHNYSKSGTYTVKLTIWLDGVETQLVKPDLIKVYEAPKALFTSSVSDTNLFAPLQVDFQNQSTKGEGDTIMYSWIINYSSEPISNDTNFSYVFDMAGTYEVQLNLNDNNGCQVGYSDYIIVKDTAQKGEFEFITSNCLSESETPSCGYDKHYNLRNDSLIIYGYYYGNCGSQKTATVRYSDDTVKIKTWEVGLWTTCNCGYCFEIIIPNFTRDSVIVKFNGEIISSSLTNIVEQKIENSIINVFPNPANDFLTIITKGLDSNDFKYKIFDTEGRIIKVGKLNGESKIDINNLTSGVYMICISDINQNEEYLMRFIKE